MSKVGLIGLLCLIIWSTIDAQDSDDCGIVATFEDNDGIHINLYMPQGDAYILLDNLTFDKSSIVTLSSLNPHEIAIVVHEDKRLNRLYVISTSGIQELESIETPPNLSISPRSGAWSSNNLFVAFESVFETGITSRLYIYDRTSQSFSQPTELSTVYNVTWSPSQELLAFRAFDARRDSGVNTINQDDDVYIASLNDSSLIRLDIDNDHLARFHWISGDELAVTLCEDLICRALIYHVATDEITEIDLGQYLLEGHLPEQNRFILSSLIDRNLFLRDELGSLTQISHTDSIISRPLLSTNQQYISYRGVVSEQYELHIVDLEDVTQPTMIVPLQDDLPEILASNARGSFPYEYTFYAKFDSWHPVNNLLLYADASGIFIANPAIGDSILAIELPDSLYIGRPRWLCLGN